MCKYWLLIIYITLLLLAGGYWLFVAFTYENPCDNVGTDYWYEVCMNEGEIDLGVQDEVDSMTSLGRIEL